MSEIAIIGAGITGAFTAYLLAERGHKVVLLDAEAQQYTPTICNPGGINPLHGPGMPGIMADFYLASHGLHLAHKARLEELSGIDYKFRVIDRLFLAFSTEEREMLQKMQQDYDAAEGFRASWYDPQQVSALDSRIADTCEGGLFTHGNLVVDSKLYCQALISAALKLGARHLKGNVEGFVSAKGKVSHVVSSGEQIPCSSVVLAAGCWTGDLASQLSVPLTVKPVKGELLVIKLQDKPFAFDITRGLTGLYQIDEELYWLGGTVDDPAIDPGVTEVGKSKILDGIQQMLPGLDNYSIVSHSAGYRPLASDKLPVVGYLPGYDNVLVGTGGGSKGILVSSGIAAELSNLVEGKPTPDFGFLTPGRFNDTV